MTRFKNFTNEEIGSLIASVDYRIVNIGIVKNPDNEDVTVSVFKTLSDLSDELHLERFYRKP